MTDVTQQTAAPAGTTAPAGTAAPATPWHGITDSEGAAYVANKGWQTAADVIKSYQGAEKLVGVDPAQLLRMPRTDDPEGFRTVAAKLGMPENPKDYAIDSPKDMPLSPEYDAFARDAFHKVGLTGKQAAELSKAHNLYLRGVAEKATKDYELNVASDKKSLETEWGGGYDRQMARAELAAKSLGLPGEVIDAIEEKVGYGATMKLFADIGLKIGEDKFVSGSSGGQRFSNTMTPGEAKAQWDAMKVDPIAVAALKDNQHPGHQAAAEKQKKLFQIMYPD